MVGDMRLGAKTSVGDSEVLKYSFSGFDIKDYNNLKCLKAPRKIFAVCF